MITGGGQGALLAQVAERTTEIYDPLQDSFSFGPNMTAERAIGIITADSGATTFRIPGSTAPA